jgi:DnaJ-class molecular chaperone
MEFKDYYQILGVPPTASQNDIRKAYRKLARQHHPDVNPGNAQAEATFREINEANEVLSDPAKRKTYDEAAAAYRQGRRPPTGPPPGPSGPTPGPRSGVYTEEDLQDLYGDQNPFSDFFSNLFGRRGGTAPPRAAGGYDLDYPLEVTLAEAYGGGRRLLEMQQPDGNSRRLEVTIPAGVNDGTRIRMAGLGGPGSPPGDLYLVVTLLPDPQFRREGADLIVDVPVKVTDCALGAEVTVAKPDGKRLAVRVPAGTQDGRRIRLRGQGLLRGVGRSDQPAQRGDLFAEIHLRLPETITPAQVRLFEQLREVGA